MNEVKLSGVVISFNEEAKIARCLNSLAQVCDEVLLLDSFSTDNTCKIAQNLGVKVFQHKFNGHIEQKNLAITYTSNPYILSLDADEELNEQLIKSILKVKKSWNYDAYSINRLNNYGGKWIKHGAWYPDKKLRLWDSRKGKWGGENPHDKFILTADSTIKHLKGNLLHYTMNGYEDLVQQTEKFSNIAAEAMFVKNRKINSVQIFGKAIYRFIKEYLLFAGFLDGTAGLQIAWMDAVYVWKKYTKLNQLKAIQQKKDAE